MMNTPIAILRVMAAGLMVCMAYCAEAGETSSPVRISLKGKVAEPDPIMRGTDLLFSPQVAPLREGASAECEMLGFDTDIQITTLSLAGRSGWLAVRGEGAAVQYAVLVEGASKAVHSALAPKPTGRVYTKLSVPVPGADESVDLFVRATGNPSQVVRYFVPTYYEGIWKQPNGEELRVALFPNGPADIFSDISSARLMIDLDANGIYKAKDPTIEKIDSSKPFRINGVSYEASTDPVARELVLTPVDKDATELQALRVGAKSPNFTAEDFDGKKVSLADFRGKFVFFDVWATWCGPCIGEIPNIQKAHEKYGRDVAIIGVSIDSDKTTAQEFVKKEKLTYPQLWQSGDFQSEVCKLYQVNGIPSTYLVDPEGNLVALSVRGEEIEKALEMASKYSQPEGRKFFEEKKEMGRLMAQVENLQDLGREEQAVKLLKDFLAAHPNSPSIEAVERWLGFLQEE